ncbi:MAG: bifunctional 4-hydroxy-2-oxoglutarate aldolase/2-dehydro-3-deoxy-phosphogluconate aldolase [Wenzhouxiangellaceae bacterium]|nr:bifunctional 4-hydroxy-2-oxoglutarate aldolase/2-dehydro-3-deoxy-phosphogluconate aldolase [Wenzhouxiangellaceae bacterium]
MKNAEIDEILSKAPVLPVLTIHDLESAAPLAQALFEAGLPVVEVTLRTPVALQAIGTMRDAVSGMIVGAGTVLSEQDLDRVEKAGAAFAISPGATPALYRAAQQASIPFVPGVATASEVMAGIEFGWSRFKFFPAEAAGGVATLMGWRGPFPDARFCPTGGISASNAAEYLHLENVITVGGSWMVPSDAIHDRDWQRIVALARDCVNLLSD